MKNIFSATFKAMNPVFLSTLFSKVYDIFYAFLKQLNAEDIVCLKKYKRWHWFSTYLFRIRRCSHPNCHHSRSLPHTPRIAVYTSRSNIGTASRNKRLKRKTELQKLINVQLLRLTRVIDLVYSGRSIFC